MLSTFASRATVRRQRAAIKARLHRPASDRLKPQRPQLAAHQPLTENADAHVTPPAGALSPASPVSSPVLFVAHLLHPLHGLATQLFLDRDVRYCRRGTGAVPVLLTRRKPDHVAGPDVLDRPAPALRAPRATGHDQRLAEWMRVPRGSRSEERRV